MRLHTVFIAAAALALGACASTESASTDSSAAPAGRDCFRAASASGFGIVDDHHVRVSSSPNRNYILTTIINTRSLDWSQAIVLDGPNWVCTGNGLGVTIVGGEPRQHYQVTEIVRDPADEQVQGS